MGEGGFDPFNQFVCFRKDIDNKYMNTTPRFVVTKIRRGRGWYGWILRCYIAYTLFFFFCIWIFIFNKNLIVFFTTVIPKIIKLCICRRM